MAQVLITERFDIKSLVSMQTHSLLQSVVHDTQWFQKPTDEWKHIDTLIIRSQTKIDKKCLSRFPSLKLIVTATAGFNHIQLDLCQERGIRVAHCPASHTASTAELTWGLILACARRLIEARNAVINEDWNRNHIMGTELHGKSIGVIGLGRVGSHVAQIARGFSMKVLAFDPFQEDEVFQKYSAERVSLEELLSQSDIVSLHVPLTKQTKHMLGDLFLESLSPESILINTCRGPVIHEMALIQKLQSKKIGAVGLDVFEYEPLDKTSLLLNFANVVTTPHIGASTHEAFAKASHEAFQKVITFFTTNKLSDELPPNAPWYQA